MAVHMGTVAMISAMSAEVVCDTDSRNSIWYRTETRMA